MLSFLTIGLVLGLSAGITPGPLFTLVIAETLSNGRRAGVIAALVPLVTDLPIVFISIFILSRYTHSATILGIISLIGGLFVCYLGYENFRIDTGGISGGVSNVTSFKKAAIVNALSPHPYLFWITVGAPTVLSASRQNYVAAVAFVSSFYLLLVGSKIFLAIVTSKSKRFLAGKTYSIVMKALGLALWVLSVFLIVEGLELLKFI